MFTPIEFVHSYNGTGLVIAFNVISPNVLLGSHYFREKCLVVCSRS